MRYEKDMTADQFKALIFKYNLQEEVRRSGFENKEVGTSCDYCQMDSPYNSEVVAASVTLDQA